MPTALDTDAGSRRRLGRSFAAGEAGDVRPAPLPSGRFPGVPHPQPGVRHGSTRLRDGVRASLEDAPEGAAPVFRTSIRYHESAAVDMRRHGLLPHELERRHASEQTARLARLHDGVRGSNGDGLLSRDAAGLSADYTALAEEVLTTIAELESAPPAMAAGDAQSTRRPAPGKR